MYEVTFTWFKNIISVSQKKCSNLLSSFSNSVVSIVSHRKKHVVEYDSIGFLLNEYDSIVDITEKL